MELNSLVLRYFGISIILVLIIHLLMRLLSNQSQWLSIGVLVVYAVISWIILRHYFVDYGCGVFRFLIKDFKSCHIVNSIIFVGMMVNTFVYYLAVFFGDVILYKKDKQID